MKRKIISALIGAIGGTLVAFLSVSHWEKQPVYFEYAEINNYECEIYPTYQPDIENQITLEDLAFKDEIPKYDIPLSDELQEHIYEVSAKNGVSNELILAVIKTESTFDVEELGDYGESIGLMQIRPKWWQELANDLGVSIYEPYGNTTVGITIIARNIDMNNGDIAKALKQYNSGNPNYPKEDYVNKVMENLEEIENLRR